MMRRKNMLFTIMPNKGFIATYVAIDTDCLKELLKVCHPQPRKRKAPKPEAPDVANALEDPNEVRKAAKLEVWSKCCSFKGLQIANHKFGFYVSTDGVSAVKMERPKSKAAAPGNLMLEGKRIVDVDPGTTDLYSAVDDADAKMKCSTTEYYYPARSNQSKARREHKLHSAANALEEWQGAILLSRTGSVASIQGHVAYVTPCLQEAPCVSWHAPAEALALELSHPQAELPARHGQAIGRRKARRRSGRIIWRGSGEAVPELDVLQAVAWLRPLQWRTRLRQRMDSMAVNKSVTGWKTPYDSRSLYLLLLYLLL